MFKLFLFPHLLLLVVEIFFEWKISHQSLSLDLGLMGELVFPFVFRENLSFVEESRLAPLRMVRKRGELKYEPMLSSFRYLLCNHTWGLSICWWTKGFGLSYRQLVGFLIWNLALALGFSFWLFCRSDSSIQPMICEGFRKKAFLRYDCDSFLSANWLAPFLIELKEICPVWLLLRLFIIDLLFSAFGCLPASFPNPVFMLLIDASCSGR